MAFPIFGNGNEKIIPNFRERESEAGIPGNGREREFPLTPAPGLAKDHTFPNFFLRLSRMYQWNVYYFPVRFSSFVLLGFLFLSCYVFSLCPVMFCSFRGFLYKERLEYLWQDDFLNEIAFYWFQGGFIQNFLCERLTFANFRCIYDRMKLPRGSKEAELRYLGGWDSARLELYF